MLCHKALEFLSITGVASASNIRAPQICEHHIYVQKKIVDVALHLLLRSLVDLIELPQSAFASICLVQDLGEVFRFHLTQ